MLFAGAPKHLLRSGLWVAVVAGTGLTAGSGPAAGQDVELLGQIHGTRPPAEYFERRGEAGAFEFARPLTRRSLGGGRPLLRRALTPLGPRTAAVSGTFVFPVVLGLFSDTPGQGPFAPADIQQSFFDGPNPTGTIGDFYSEMSGGLVDIQGATQPWQRSSLSAAHVAGGSSGLGFNAQVGEFIVELIAALDTTGVDWGHFDSDGPDGIPNSGDDDGFVDVLTVMHPTVGAECSGNQASGRIWSHRWTLAAQGTGPYTTATPAAGGGSIRIDDYTIQPSFSCDGTSLAEIGVFAHELGHGFGLPDLYSVGHAFHKGIGKWGLMGSGSWGCPGPFNPARPCHMSPWSKIALGWLAPTRIATDAALGRVSLDPVTHSHTVLEVPSGDGSGQYLLLENRQPVGFNDNLERGGLLVWRIDPAQTAANWAFNTINSDPSRLGVQLLQADGLDHLGSSGGGRGDEGDPFPGATSNPVLHASSHPASRGPGGEPMGITVTDITETGQSVSFDLWTRYQTIRIEPSGASGSAGALVAVDGATGPPGAWSIRSAPFQAHAISAAAGAPLSPGQRIPFQAWSDGAPRERTFVTGLADTTLVATYAGHEIEIAVTETSAQPLVDPADIAFSPTSPDGWVSAGATVTVEARPNTGFAFESWGGAFSGEPNPTTVTVTAPLAVEARFTVTFATSVDEVLGAEAARPAELPLTAVNANPPLTWTLVDGTLPAGMVLDARGTIRGTPMALGAFPLELEVVDAIGLHGRVSAVLEVAAPLLSVEVLAGPFLGTGETPSSTERTFLDRNGNRNGRYDLGDFRAFLMTGSTAAGEAIADLTIAALLGRAPAGEARR